MSPRNIATLAEQLSPRDLIVVDTLHDYRMASTSQLRRLHFRESFASLSVASRVTQKVLRRLEAQGLLKRLQRRIGGVRAGSASIIWTLGPAGERLAAYRHNKRVHRGYREPSTTFAAHTVAVTELAVRLHETLFTGAIEQLMIEAEPDCWRRFVGPYGQVVDLKPDLYVITASGDYEDHWFLEMDMGTENAPALARKATVYQQYAHAGLHQAAHGVMPAIVWIVPSVNRQRAVESALDGYDRTRPQAVARRHDHPLRGSDRERCCPGK
jgi:hypothetical protein